jgi:mono/diheme cytochrome c family protein
MATGRPVENPNARYPDPAKPALAVPAPYGGHNWQPMAFDPQEGLVYIPAMEVPFGYGDDSAFSYHDGGWNTGINVLLSALPNDKAQVTAMKSMLHGTLIAWDPVKQAPRWQVDHPYFWNAGVLATGGGLVFQGSAEGKFAAYSAKDGHLVWTYEAGNGVIAAPATYEIDGEQYIAVMVGYGGAAPLAANVFLGNQPRMPGRLLVFKIGGKATVAPYPKAPDAGVDLTQVTSSGDPAKGKLLFHQNCSVCHGPNASGHYLPNLRRSVMVQSADSFKSVVLDGARKDRGMVSFAKFFGPKEAEDIRAYILQEARGETPPPPAGRPPSVNK